MALDPHYITDGPLQEYFVDKDTGLPLSGGIVTFYRDSSRITPKAVYELSGSPPNYTYTPLPNPITLSSVGTFQDASGNDIVVYYYPWMADGVTPDLYYITVQDSHGVDQFTREAWPNSAIEGGSGPSGSSLPVQNQISNPQFSQIFINNVPTLSPSTTTFTVTGSNKVFEVAPNWELIASSSGTDTVVVQRLALSGSLGAPTNPPFALSVTTGINITTCRLRQKFFTNSGLWTSTTGTPLFLSSGIVVKNLINVATNVSMFYQASSGNLNTTPFQLMSQTVGPSADYTYYTAGSAQMPISDDTLSGDDGFVYIYIEFTPGSSVAITSVQVVPSVNVSSAPLLAYDEASSNRDEALLGDYYLPRTTTSPIPSILTGWDFPLNPAQFGATPTANTTADYIWDQTICLTSSGNVAVSRNSATNGLVLTPASNNQSCYILQYLEGAQVFDMLYNRLSTNISAWLGSGGGNVQMSVYLYRGPSTSSIPTLPTPLVAISSAGVLSSLAAGWTLIPRSGLDTPRSKLTTTLPTLFEDIQFSGWEITDPAQIADTDKFAMVVTFTWDTATVINVNSISLNKGDLPTRPAAQTVSDVLSQCQQYYEKSYDQGVNPGSVSAAGALIAQQGCNVDTDGTHDEIATRSFGITYKVPKRAAATVTLYSPVTGASAFVSYTFSFKGVIQGGYPYDQGLQTGTNPNIIGWVETGGGQFGTSYISNSQIVIDHPGSVQNGTDETYIKFHYTADSRLGKV